MSVNFRVLFIATDMPPLCAVQVLSAAAHPPCASYSFFLVKLLRTVRANIGECAAAAYRTLTVAAASDILMFSSSQVRVDGCCLLHNRIFISTLLFFKETMEFISENYPHWEISGDSITLCGVKVSKSEEIPAMKLISQTLSYASELERIV